MISEKYYNFIKNQLTVKIKIILLALLVQATISSLHAQKSAPVAGHAAELIDLLKKDYTTLDPQNRGELLNIDRARVIAIFKTYANNHLESVDISSEVKAIEDERKNIRTSENQIGAIKSSTTNRTGTTTESEFSKIEGYKEEIYKQQFKIHEKELENIGNYYKYSNPYLFSIANTFLRKYKNLASSFTDVEAKINYESSLQKSSSFLSAGGFNINALVAGLTDFLAERIKAEIVNYTMEHIKNKLENPDKESLLPELMALLPKTVAYIKQFEDVEILKFTESFRAHIEADVKNLVQNIDNLKTTPRFIELLSKHPDLELAFEAVELIPQLASIDHPVDFFEKLEASKTLRKWTLAPEEANSKFNIANTVKLINFIAHSLLVVNKSDVRRFASTQFMSNYMADPKFFMLYIGFLHQQNTKYYHIEFVKKTGEKYQLRFDKLMNTITPNKINTTENNVKIITQSIIGITDNAEKLYQEAQTIKRLSSDDDKKVDMELVNGFINSFLDFFEDTLEASYEILETAEATNLLFNKDLKLSTQLANFKTSIQPYIATAKSVNTITLQLHQKEYGLAIEEALEIPINFTNNTIYSNQVLGWVNEIKESEIFNLLHLIINSEKVFSEESEELKKVFSFIEDFNAPDFSELKAAINTFKNKPIKTVEDYVSIIQKVKEFVSTSGKAQDLILDKIFNIDINNLKIQAATNHVLENLLKKLEACESYEVQRIHAIINRFKQADDNQKKEILEELKRSLKEVKVVKLLVNKLFGVDFTIEGTVFIHKILKKLDEKLSQVAELENIKTIVANIARNTANYKNEIINLRVELKKKEVKEAILHEFFQLDIENSVKKKLFTLLNKEEIEKVNTYVDKDLPTIIIEIGKETTLKNKEQLISKLKSIHSLQDQIISYLDYGINYFLFKENKDDLKAIREKMLISFGKQLFANLTKNTTVSKSKDLVNIVNFVSTTAKAENSEDVKKALESYALPTGSYSLKRESSFNVSINSYPGLLVGYDSNANVKNGWATGITAPVGISITPFSLKRVTFFFPIIDVGAPLRFRLYNNQEETIKKLPELSFKNILTPGAYVSFGLGKSPFALNLGVQYGPELSIEGEDLSIKDKSSWSFNCGFVVDIPLFTIYNKPQEAN